MKKFIHIDMDCFFAAIEMRDNPGLRDIPIAVGGAVEERGVISTANYSARQFGIHSAMPTAVALKRCPQLKLLPDRMEVYEAVSAQIHTIFSRYTALIEPISLDEAYLDVTDSFCCHGSATLIAEEIRRAIHAETQLTASAGVSSVKFLSKIASEINKPNGIFCIPPNQVDSFLKELPLIKIPGIGPKTNTHLQRLGFKTCADIRTSNVAVLLREFGRFGLTIWERCHGVDENSVCTTPIRRSVGVEATFPHDIHHWDDCERKIVDLYPELLQRLTAYSADNKIKYLGVKLKFDDFRLTTHDRNYPLLDILEILTAARHVWDSRRAGRGVRLIGIHVGLADNFLYSQLPLFLNPPHATKSLERYMESKKYIVKKNHTSEFPEPITFLKGTQLNVVEKYEGEEEWDNWYFCEIPGQKGGYVPGDVIDFLNENTARAIEDYTARELTVKEGTRLVSTMAMNGWAWCETQDSRTSGWVPLVNLQDAIS